MGKPPNKGPVPKVRSEVDITRLPLSAEEGRVAAMLDGTITLDQLTLIAGLSRERVDQILAHLHELGALDGGGSLGSRPPQTTEPLPEVEYPSEALAESVDLSLEEKKRILAMHAQLGAWSHYEVLGIKRRAGTQDVKRAFQARSMEWHPQRWRRQRLGSFEQRLKEIFRRVQDAKNVLVDEKKREAYDAEHAHLVLDEEDLREMEKQRDRRRREERRAQEAEQRRKKRNPMRRRLEQAREMMGEAKELQSTGDFVAALRAAQTAEAFAPSTEDLQDLLQELKEQAGEQRVEPWIRRGRQAEISTRYDAAIPLYREAVRLVPNHPLANQRLGYCMVQMGQELGEAKQRLQRAVAAEPKEAENHYVLGLCYEKMGLKDSAVASYKKTLELKDNHQQAKKRLNKLKWGFEF